MRKKPSTSNDISKLNKFTYQRGNHARDGSPHYVFLYSDDECDDNDIQMQPQKCDKQLPRKVEVINVNIKADDTLQALALRYRCTISELKRINKIHKENEIFARNKIKVPVQAFSILTELNNDADGSNNGDVDPLDAATKTIPNSKVKVDDSSIINNLILNSVCEPLTSVNKDDDDDDVDDEHQELLLNNSDIKNNLSEKQVIDDLSCSGADWGLSWIHLLAITLFLGLLLPIIYIFLYTEHKKDHDNLIHPTNDSVDINANN